MCLIYIVKNQHPDYALIVAANRDEFYARPTAEVSFWQDHPEILAGRDLQAKGTWLGVSRQGRFAALTNYRKPDTQEYTHSRGDIPKAFLSSTQSQQAFADWLTERQADFSGFNCLFAQFIDAQLVMHYFNNQTATTVEINEGIYGLSNGLMDDPWPKVTEGKAAIKQLLKGDIEHEAWFDLLNNKTIATDASLPDTGVGIDKERVLSPRFIHLDNYGTRCSSLLTINHKGVVSFSERTFDHNAIAISQRNHNFQL